MNELESVKVYLTYRLLKSKKAPNDFEDLLKNGYSSSQNIFLRESKTESMERFADNLKSWLNERNIKGKSRLFLLKDEDFKEVNRENFYEFQVEQPLKTLDFSVEWKNRYKKTLSLLMKLSAFSWFCIY